MTEKKPRAGAKNTPKRTTAKRQAPKIKRLNAQEKVRRDAEVVRLYLSYPTRTWEWVATEVSAMKPNWKIAAMTARHVVEEWRKEKADELANPNAIDIVQEHLAGYRQLREDLAKTAHEAAGGIAYRPGKDGVEEKITLTPQPNNVIGALKTIADLRGKEIALLQETGLLPKNLGRLEMELDVRRLQEVVLIVIDRFVPEEDRPNAELFLLDALQEQLPGSRALAVIEA